LSGDNLIKKKETHSTFIDHLLGMSNPDIEMEKKAFLSFESSGKDKKKKILKRA